MYFSRLQGIASLKVHAPVPLSFPPSFPRLWDLPRALAGFQLAAISHLGLPSADIAGWGHHVWLKSHVYLFVCTYVDYTCTGKHTHGAHVETGGQ